jgi:hypothetical protein
MSQIERLARLDFTQSLRFSVDRRGLPSAEISEGNFERRLRLNDLHGLAGVQFDASSQYFVPPHDLVNRTLEDREIQWSKQPPSHTDITCGITRRYAIELPEALLLKRQRRVDIATMTPRDCGLSGHVQFLIADLRCNCWFTYQTFPLWNRLGDRGDGAMLKDLLGVQADSGLAGAHDDLQDSQRIGA